MDDEDDDENEEEEVEVVLSSSIKFKWEATNFRTSPIVSLVRNVPSK